MDSVWRVEVLGTFQATSRDTTVSKFRTRRVSSLLAFLALHPDRSFTRDELAEMLWPDSDPQVSRRNLRQALLSLRHVLEPPPIPARSILISEQSRIRLNSNAVSTDAAELHRLVQRWRSGGDVLALTKAVDLYKGELLPGFDDAWVFNARLDLEDAYLSALVGLREAGEMGEGGKYLRALIAIHPPDEGLQVELMRHYIGVGQPGLAVRQFDELVDAVAQVGSEPSEIALDLLEKARRLAENPPRRTVLPTGVGGPEEERVSLPLQATRLFGRQIEIAAIVDHFTCARSRLLTILGPAGTGKTRLSVEASRALAENSEWRIWFVPLADIDSPSLLFDRILDTVRPKRRGSGEPLAQLVAALDRSNTLVILDNFEHLMDLGADQVRRLLDSVPQVMCLVTSRQSLKLENETEFSLSPLSIPSPEESSADRLAVYPSIQLFVDRCQAIRPDFQLTTKNARYLSVICMRLEGIPLAIEIAAGLSNAFTPAQMLGHLENRLEVLTSRRRDITPRHRSLRAAIDYSYAFLSPELQMFFASLSVFRGGFTEAASSEICGVTHGLNLLLDLQERSFIGAEENGIEGAAPRYRMLEIFREYGEEVLDSEEQESLRAKHAAHYLAACQPDSAANLAEERARLHVAIEADYNNLLAALEFFIHRGQLINAIRLVTGLSTIWDVRGTKSVEQRYIRFISRMPEIEAVPPADRIQLLRALGTTYLRDSDFRSAFQACEEGLQVALATGDRDLIATSTFGMALCAGYLGEAARCLSLCQQVLENASPTNGVLLERTYVSIGSAHWSQDSLAEAEVAFLKAKEVSAEFRDGEADPLILVHLSGVYLDQGRADDAMSMASEAVRQSLRVRNDISLAAAHAQVARYQRSAGNLADALASSREGLAKCQSLGIAIISLELLRGHGLLLAELGSFEMAAVLLAVTRSLEATERSSEKRDREVALERVRAGLSGGAFERAWAWGLGMELEDALKLVLAAQL